MKYHDLDIRVGPLNGESYPIRAESEVLEAKQGTLPTAEFNQTCEFLAQSFQGSVSITVLHEAGRKLFNTLFSGSVGLLYQQALEQAGKDEAGIRVRLTLEPGEVAALPWELIYDADRDCFLSTSSETLLTRYVEIAKPIRGLATSLPIRILTIIPDDTSLDTQHVQSVLNEALKVVGDAVELHFHTGEVTSSSINRELVLKQFHILHFIGEGTFKNDDACLVLNGKADGEHTLITAKEFSYYFQDSPWMKLVVLNSWGESAHSSEALTSAAAEFVQLGLPAAVATRRRISESALKTFVESFYFKLCRGFERGRVDIAVSHGRKRLLAELSDTDLFSTPELFMRSPKGVIFDLESEGTTDLRELHRMNAVNRTHEYNIHQLKQAGGDEAEKGIASETKAKSALRARVRQFYGRVALSAAPRVLIMILLLTIVFFLASSLRILNVFRVDDYTGGALRIWSESPNRPILPEVQVIIADEGNNGGLGSPVRNTSWRLNHAAIINALAGKDRKSTAPQGKPKVVAFDLEFDQPGPTAELSSAVDFAKSQGVPVVAGTQIDNQGNKTKTPGGELSKALGNDLGDTMVGGFLNLPLLRAAYINVYEIASLPPDTPEIVDGEVPVNPSLALQAILRAYPGATATYDGGRQDVVLRTRDSNGGFERHIPVTRTNLSLDMLLDYAPRDSLKSNTNQYGDVHQWATNPSQQYRQFLEDSFRDKIVLIGYDTTADRHAVIGDGSRSGIYIHANAISNILNQTYIPEISGTLNFIIILLMATLGVLLQTHVRRWLPSSVSNIKLKLPVIKDIFGDIPIPVVLASAIVIYLLAAYLLYSRSRISFDMSYHIAALLFGYWLIMIFRKRLRLSNQK